MKRISIILSLCLFAFVACTSEYKPDYELSLDRDEFRFNKDLGESYFRIFTDGRWTAEFEKEVDWVTLDKTEGFGESQVKIAVTANTGLSRGVNLVITHEDGTKNNLYVSQKKGLGKDTPAYSVSKESVRLLGDASSTAVAAISNISEEAVSTAVTKVVYNKNDEGGWITDVAVTSDRIAFSTSENTSGFERAAQIEVAIQGAKWDTPYTVFVTVFQGGDAPSITLLPEYSLNTYGAQTTSVIATPNWDVELGLEYVLDSFEFSDASFFTYEYDEETGTLFITPDINQTGEPKETTLTWYVKNSAGAILNQATTKLVQGVSQIQFEKTHLNLTEGGKYANCYILPQNDESYYCVEPKLVSGILPAENIASARILWQTSENVLSYVEYNPLDKMVYVAKPAGVIGSAVVAITDSDDKIVWSLHFWASGDELSDCTIGGYVFMDRNIGAKTNKAPVNNESDAAGMHYQWGRKDPFPPAVILSSPNANRSTVYPDDAIVMIEAQDGVALSEVISTPGNYYWGSKAAGNENWCYTPDDSYWSTEKKTDFDPCPYGYVVPSKEQLEKVCDKQVKGTKGVNVTCDDGNKNFWVAAGWYRRTKGTTHLANVGNNPYYWTTASDTYNTSYRGSYAMEGGSLKVWARRWGASVRCVKQANNQ